jgi:hypothetical protein
MLEGAGQQQGTESSDSTLEAAADAIAGLLSPREDTQPREPKKTTAAKAPASQSDPVEVDDPPEAEDEEAAEPEDDGQTEQADAEGESPADDEQPDDAPAQPRKLRVPKGDGEFDEVTEDEAVKGYLRQQDYTRKTQTLAEQRKAHEAEANAVRAERQQYADSLKQLEAAIKAQVPAEPDWAKLQQDKPDEFAVTWAAWHRHKEEMSAFEAERKRAEDAVLKDQFEAMRKRVDEEQGKLVEAIPAWQDADVRKKELTEIKEFAKKAGYSDEELSQVVDHRVITLLRKAYLYDKAQDAAPKVRAKIEQAKVVPPGTGQKKTPVSELTRTKQRLAKTGRVEDAADAIRQLLTPQRAGR